MIDFEDVKAGDLGGYVESDKNLVKDLKVSSAWIYDDAKVYGSAKVEEDARVSGKAQVFGKAKLNGKARIYGNAQIYGHAVISDDAQVYGDARVYDDAQIFNHARVSCYAEVCENAQVCEGAYVYGNARISNNSLIKDRDDWQCFKGARSALTAYRTQNGSIELREHDFTGTVVEFRKYLESTDRIEQKNKKYYELLLPAIEFWFNQDADS